MLSAFLKRFGPRTIPLLAWSNLTIQISLPDRNRPFSTASLNENAFDDSMMDLPCPGNPGNPLPFRSPFQPAPGATSVTCVANSPGTRRGTQNLELGAAASGAAGWEGGKWKAHMNSEDHRELCFKYHEITKIGIHHN